MIELKHASLKIRCLQRHLSPLRRLLALCPRWLWELQKFFLFTVLKGGALIGRHLPTPILRTEQTFSLVDIPLYFSARRSLLCYLYLCLQTKVSVPQSLLLACIQVIAHRPACSFETNPTLFYPADQHTLYSIMTFTYGIDHLEPAFSDRPIPYITYGLPFDEACAYHVESTLQASRVYIIASKSLSTNTSAPQRLHRALGDKVVGTRIGMAPHTHWDEVLEVAQDAAPRTPDCIVTLGAGSLTDAAKVVAWMLANDVTTSDGLEKLASVAEKDTPSGFNPPQIRHIAIPTSLSGGEYQALAGVTRDDGSHLKQPFYPPPRNPSLVVLDPELTKTTPERIWLSTGVRAVDHCVETLCSLLSNENGDVDAEKGLLKLVPSLIRTHRDPGDLDARFESQRGVIEAMSAVSSGVPLGASHGIGHQLGPLGVGHGETSCILLPAVCKYNAKENVNVDRQQYCKSVLLRSPVVKGVLRAKYAEQDLGKLDLGDVLDAIFRDLGMPRSLKDVGVGRDKLDALAENSLRDWWCKTNAKPLTEKAQVLEILEMVVE